MGGAFIEWAGLQLPVKVPEFLCVRSISKMKQVSVVLLLSFAHLFCCGQAQYRVEFVLITDKCCKNRSNVANFPANVRVEFRGMNSSSWRSLRNHTEVKSQSS